MLGHYVAPTGVRQQGCIYVMSGGRKGEGGSLGGRQS